MSLQTHTTRWTTAAVLLLGLSGAGLETQAALISQTVNGVDLVYDDVADLTWVADANLFKTQYDADNNIVNDIISQIGSITSGNGTYTLTVSDFNAYGIWDGRMTWYGAMAWADWLDYGGVSDWRLPLTAQPDTNCSYSFTPSSYPTQHYGYNCTGSELGNLFYNEGKLTQGQGILSIPNGYADSILDGYFDNMQSDVYWSGTEYAPFPNLAWLFYTYHGYLLLL